MAAKNRAAFLELEPTEIDRDELWQLTGFTRCADCGYLIHTETLAALPEHHCTQRKRMADQLSEREAAATLARECTDHAAVILWCADRVRAVDDDPDVQDAADHLHSLSTRAQVDATPVTDRTAVIRWCAQEIHSMGGDYAVERAAEYLDDLAADGAEAPS